MISKVFAVYDVKAEAYHPPFLSQSQGTAVRQMVDLVLREGHLYCAHAEDFGLFHLGEFDDTNAAYELIAPVRVCSLHELKAEAMNNG